MLKFDAQRSHVQMGGETMIEFKNVYKSYKDKSVLTNVNLTISTGEFFVLIGSSGCGKTTLLKTVNKLNTIDQGSILINDVDIRKTNTIALRRKIGYVVQYGGLFPHLTVSENISLILRKQGLSRTECDEKANSLLEAETFSGTRTLNASLKLYFSTI